MPPAAILAGSVAAPIAGGVIGNLAGAGDREQAMALQQQALQNIMNVQTPDVDQMRLALQQYQSAGQLTPEMESAIKAGPSELKNINLDPRLMQAQMNALSQLQQVGAGGLRPEDMAALAKIQNQTAQDENARQQSILQNMQARGVGGSGAELAARLQSSQSAANRQNNAGLDIAGQASQRALQAIMNAGSLGGQIGAQQFGQQEDVARAQDVINQYNAMNQQQVGNTNVGLRNQAQASNLSNLQNIMNANTGLSNQQQQYNKQLLQQNFQNQMGKAQAQSGAQKDMAGAYQNEAQRVGQMWSGIGQGVGQGIGAFGAMPKAAPASAPMSFEEMLKQGHGG